MTGTLKQQFEGKRKSRWIMAGLLGLAGLVAWNYRDVQSATQHVETLREAIARVDPGKLRRPYSNRAFKGIPLSHWNWVDASRRDEMLATQREDKERAAIEVMLKLANGRRFLFTPGLNQAFIDTAQGVMFVRRLSIWPKRVPYALARDQESGPGLLLAPYWIGEDVVAIPAEKLLDLLTIFMDSPVGQSWQCPMNYAAKGIDAIFISGFLVEDPIPALHFIKEARS